MVNSPYGGRLKISLELNNQEKHLDGLNEAIKIKPFVDFFYDSLKIGDGSYSPLEGFMGEEELNYVLQKKKLLSDLPWTMPIIFALDGETNEILKPGDQIALVDQSDVPYGTMDIETKYRLNK
ncbi:MAG: hypothetical protein QXU18_10045, partial [Thermoplasmatales archaeon]